MSFIDKDQRITSRQTKNKHNFMETSVTSSLLSSFFPSRLELFCLMVDVSYVKGTQSADAHARQIPFLSCMICMSQDTRVKQKVRSASRILQTNLLELNLLQAEIVIINPMPYQSTHFLYTIYIENSPMALSRESQTSTNTSEFDHRQR